MEAQVRNGQILLWPGVVELVVMERAAGVATGFLVFTVSVRR